MKTFIRENPTIAFGLGLPLLLVALFLAISGVPALLVAPARHDVLYLTNVNYYNNAQSTIQIAVIGNKVQVNYIGNTQPYQVVRLWRFTPATGAVREISLSLPAGLTANTGQPMEPPKTPAVTPIEVPELLGVNVDTSSLAPDGYEFRTGADVYSGNVFGGFFQSSRYRNLAELVKDGRSIRLPNTDGAYYGNSVRFIGWIVSP